MSLTGVNDLKGKKNEKKNEWNVNYHNHIVTIDTRALAGSSTFNNIIPKLLWLL